ncbi:benomyl/methotrexate resistance protein [Trichoderma arundinaceum]|uniref:Benomyl/methotrexate resistance protein n=1 Tax=Trichoderma arundinaceum TaxID=490622 RepID=A0A395P1L6_TRIAR|nr:benomyl/methotrexate resistance protein [Trichoderma arundinaceum]
MTSLLRDTTFGALIRWATKRKVLKYSEETAAFHYQNLYTNGSPANVTPLPGPRIDNHSGENHWNDGRSPAVTPAPTESCSHSSEGNEINDQTLSKIISRPQLSLVGSLASLEQAYTAATLQANVRSQHSRIQPKELEDGIILVDWYTTDDPENPQNWSSQKKAFVVLQIYLYTLAVYIGSAIITPSQPYIEAQFGVEPEVASLGLSLYVLGYGIGPLLFSPLSEIPAIGRNPPYIITFGIFVAISAGTATVDNFPALIVLRFLQGFFGSPCLATGGASLGDVYNLVKLPYALTGWAAFATAGPAIGPILSGFSVPATNWHWSLWEILWLASPVFVLMFFFLPETSTANILLRRAQRLRRLTKNNNLRSQSENDQARLTVNEVIVQSLWRPLQINLFDPSVLFTSLYTGLMYGIFYSFFEVFPFVYSTGLPGLASPTNGYGMNAGQVGLIFLSISVGVSIAIICYVTYLKLVFEPEIRTRGLGEPERRLVCGLPASFLVPIGLFMFGWTGNPSPSIPWIVPTIGITIFVIGIFTIFQVIFIYIAISYPMYSASLFAANDFVRSSLGCGYDIGTTESQI